MRFIVIDEDGPIRKFKTLREAKLYVKRHVGTWIKEVPMYEFYGEALL